MQESGSVDRSPRARARRWALAGVGVVLVGFGALGAMLPGLPTTVFLLAASYCFTRSCPRLEEVLIRKNRLFRSYVGLLDPARPMPRRARIAAIATMWSFIVVSLVLLGVGGALSPVLAATILTAGVGGTVAIVLFKRNLAASPATVEEADA